MPLISQKLPKVNMTTIRTAQSSGRCREKNIRPPPFDYGTDVGRRQDVKFLKSAKFEATMFIRPIKTVQITGRLCPQLPTRSSALDPAGDLAPESGVCRPQSANTRYRKNDDPPLPGHNAGGETPISLCSTSTVFERLQSLITQQTRKHKQSVVSTCRLMPATAAISGPWSLATVRRDGFRNRVTLTCHLLTPGSMLATRLL